MSAVLNLNEDIFSIVASFLSAPEICSGRLICKHFLRLLESDCVWAAWAIDQKGFTRFSPLTSGHRCSTTSVNARQVKGWKQFVRSLRIDRFPCLWEDEAVHRKLIDEVGQWTTVATSSDRNNGEVVFRPSILDVLDKTCPVAPVSTTAANTYSTGFILTTPVIATEQNFLMAIQSQMLEYLGVQTYRPELLLKRWLHNDMPSASIEMFSLVPTVEVAVHNAHGGSNNGIGPSVVSHSKCVFVLRMSTEAQRNPKAVATLMTTLFHVCSAVHFVGHSLDDITRFAEWFGSASGGMTTVSAGPFSTPENTPNVVFAVERLPTGVSVNDIASEVLSSAPQELKSWILNRSSCVGGSLLSHKNLFTSCKPLKCPAWVNPAASCAVPPTAAVRMIRAHIEEHNCWSLEVMKHICGSQESSNRRFYEDAIRLEFEDHTRRSGQEQSNFLSNIHTIPMDPLVLVEAHNLYFYATVRKYACTLHTVCGRDSDAGMKLMEVLKRNVSDVFRLFWRRNNDFSRDYCTSLFEHTFQSLESKYGPDVTHEDALAVTMDKKGLKHWYRLVRDKVHEYELKARGLRQYDILAEEISTLVIPQIMHFVAEHPSKFFSLVDVRNACDDLNAEIKKATSQYSKNTDGRLNKAQHESALYNAALSNELAAQFQRLAAEYLQRVAMEAEGWEQACLSRIRILCSSNALASRKRRGSSCVNDELTSSASSAAVTDDVTGEESIHMCSSASGHEVDSLLDNDYTDEDTAEEQRIQSTQAESREQAIKETFAAEMDLRAQAARLTSRIPTESHASEFDVVAKVRGQRSVIRRLQDAFRMLVE